MKRSSTEYENSAIVELNAPEGDLKRAHVYAMLANAAATAEQTKLTEDLDVIARRADV